MAKGKVSKYFKYAIGEIVLVVIGILIALSINNWNEKRINKNIAYNYIENLKEELNIQINSLNSVHLSRQERKMNGLKSAKSYFENPFEIKDTINFLSNISYGAVGSYGVQDFNRNVFESLINTGVIANIEDTLRNEIITHFEYSNLVATRTQIQASSYQDLVNGLKPFDPDDAKQISKTDQNRFMKALRTEEFIRQVNIEISNGLRSFNRTKNVEKSAKALIILLDKYLENH